jgi:hypothetical protein
VPNALFRRPCNATSGWFNEMFTRTSDKAVIASVGDRAVKLPRSIGEKVLIDLIRYDISRHPGRSEAQRLSLSNVLMIARKTGRHAFHAISACSAVLAPVVQAKLYIHPGRTRTTSAATTWTITPPVSEEPDKTTK